MNQYCRYCNNANLIGDDIFFCQPKNEVYDMAKSKRINKCKNFNYNENDLWRCDENGNFQTYKPRRWGIISDKSGTIMENMSLWEET